MRRRMSALQRKYFGRRRRTKGHRRRRRNPGLAEYLMNKPRHRRRRTRGRHRYHRRYRRRNMPRARHRRRRTRGVMGALALPAAFKNPVGYLTEGASAFIGVYWAITGGNFLLGFVWPRALVGIDLQSRIVRYVSRIFAAAAGDLVLSTMRVNPATHRAYRVGATVGVVGSILFDLLGKGFVIGAGDTAQNPGFALAGLDAYVYGTTGPGQILNDDLGDISAYYADPMSLQGAGAYMLTQRRLRGLDNYSEALAGVGGAHRLYGGSWRADG